MLTVEHLPDGTVLTAPPPADHVPDLYIVDLVKDPTLKPPVDIDYAALRANLDSFWRAGGQQNPRWLLAGGLVGSRVEDAVRLMSPNGVDVCRGVCGPDGRCGLHCTTDRQLHNGPRNTLTALFARVLSCSAKFQTSLGKPLAHLVSVVKLVHFY